MGALRTPVPRIPSRPDEEVDEGALELSEVPATVVCATCGLPECNFDIDLLSSFSGVMAIVPWEWPGGTVLSRLSRGRERLRALMAGAVPRANLKVVR